jgi:uncharacterized repeat protein (TIGR03803 family)
MLRRVSLRSYPINLSHTFGRLTLVFLLGAFALTVPATAQTESTIYSFTQHESFWPEGGLVEDASGNLYGTTVGGGSYGTGTVYQLSPPVKGSTTWTKKVLYNFQPWGITGYTPSSELAIDSKGDLYGVTWTGGEGRCHCGVLYELVPPATVGGAWTHLVLHAFTNTNNDGRLPNAPVVLSSSTIYGVTQQGGLHDSGIVYQFVPGKSGGTYSVLYSFGANNDASWPNGPVLLDSTGSLYGVTSLGGAFNAGAVFKLSPPQSTGAWTESILFSFGGGSQSSGITPVGNLLFDSLGNLYGVTEVGGASQLGVAYELSPASGSSSSTWTENVLFNFSKPAGSTPLAGLTWNPSNGSLYGTASAGASHTHGAVFQLTPPASGGLWTETLLQQFTFANNGGLPSGRVLRDATTGYLYGTTYNGGASGCDGDCGVDYQIIP